MTQHVTPPALGALAWVRMHDAGAASAARERLAHAARDAPPGPDTERRAFEAGLKALWKRERVPAGAVDGLRADLQARGVPCATFADAGGRSHTLFAAHDTSLLERARTLEADERRSGAQRGAAMRWFGEALGYPPCCIDAFAALPAQHDMAVLSRLLGAGAGWLELPAEANFLLPPSGPVTHYPCALACPATRALGARTLEILPADEAALLRARSTWPLLVWDRFRMLLLEEARPSEGAVRYARAHLPLTVSDEPLFRAGRAVQAFATHVAPLFVASDLVRFEGDTWHLSHAEEPVATLRFAGAPPWRVRPIPEERAL